ncbi:MAG: flippase [Candidatus Omnitrophota bacterium]
MEKLEKNFLWLSAANVTASFFGIIIFIYLARVLQAESFGYLSYATTIVFYLLNFTDFGLSTYGIREIAKDKESSREYVSNIISFKIIVAAALFTCFIIAVSLSLQSQLLKVLMAEAALMIFMSALATEWAFQGAEKMHMVFISLVVTSSLQFALTYFFVKGPADILKVPLITFIGSLPVIVVFLRKLRFKLCVGCLDLSRLKIYLSSSIAIWAISVFAQAYNGLDIVILGFFRPPEEVGCFTIARRAIGGAALIMVVLANAVLPHLSSNFLKNTEQFKYATGKFLRLSMGVMLFVFLPIILFSKEFIELTVGSQYVTAAMPLKIMAMALILVLFNLPYSTGLIAVGLEREVLKQAVASAALSIISNFILIPRYGMIGAAISFFLAELLALVWILYVYRKKIEGREVAI